MSDTVSKSRTDTITGADDGLLAAGEPDADTLLAFDGDDTLRGEDVLAGEQPDYPPAPEGIDLVVTSAFASYAVGERITDRATIAEILARTPHYVVATAAQPPAETSDEL